MKCKKVTSMFLSVLIAVMINGLYCCFADEVEDAEFLYLQMTKFLDEHKDIEPEHFDDVCKDFMGARIPEANLLSGSDFEARSKGNVILYRGVPEKKYADELKQGKVFLSCWNERGSGIYTTTTEACAKSFSDDKNLDDTLMRMFIQKDKVRILDNAYLERLKEIIIEKHREEFGGFENKKRNDYNSAAECMNKVFAEVQKEAVENRVPDEEFLKFFKEKAEKDPVIQKIRKEGKKYFTSNKAYVWFNSGLLARLMGYDVLYTVDALSESYVDPAEEYLIVNPNVLNVLAK